MASGRRFLKSGRDQRWQRKNLINLAVEKFHRYLDSAKTVFMGKIGGSLRMLKVKSFVRTRSPITQSTKVKARARVLQKDFHTLAFFAFCSCRSDRGHN